MSSVKKNLLYNLTYQLLIIIIPFITTPYISRVVGSNGVGVYNYTYSFAYLCYLFGKLGLDNYGNRSVAMVSDDRHELSKTFISIYYMQMITSFLVILVYIAFLVVNKSYQNIFYLQFFYVLSSLFDINWFFFGTQEFKLNVVRNAIIKVASLLLILTLVKTRNDLWIYTLILSLSALLSQLVLWPFLKDRIDFIHVSFSDVFAHFKENLVLFIPVIAVSVYTYMDKIILGSMSSMNETGYYSNAEKVIQLPLSLVGAFGAVMLPKMTNLLVGKDSDKRSEIYIYKSIKYMVILAASTSFGLAAISPEFTVLFLGEDFRACIPMIISLSSTIIFVSWASVIRTQFLIPRKFDSIYIKSVIYGALINIVANLAFVPYFDAMGSVLGTILAELTVAIYQTNAVKELLPIKKYLKNTWVYLLNGFIMLIFVRMSAHLFRMITSSNIVLIIIEVLVGVIVYTLLLLTYTIKYDENLYNEIFGVFLRKIF